MASRVEMVSSAKFRSRIAQCPRADRDQTTSGKAVAHWSGVWHAPARRPGRLGCHGDYARAYRAAAIEDAIPPGKLRGTGHNKLRKQLIPSIAARKSNCAKDYVVRLDTRSRYLGNLYHDARQCMVLPSQQRRISQNSAVISLHASNDHCLSSKSSAECRGQEW